MSRRWKFLLFAILLSTSAAGIWYRWLRVQPDPAVAASLQSVTLAYRKIIILMDGAAALDDLTRARCRTAGRILFDEKQQALARLESAATGNAAVSRQILRYIRTTVPHDADRLAFLDLLEAMAAPAAAPDADVKAELDDVRSIQNSYREEVSRIFSQFATRGPQGKREKWDSYVAWLKKSLNREKILADYTDIITDEISELAAVQRGRIVTSIAGVVPPKLQEPGHGDNEHEVSGVSFEPKTVALTFDDGPHPRYTEEVAALLRKYGIRAAFFEVGRSLGTVTGPEKTVKLLKTAEISKRLLDAGHTIANHTFSHRALPKLTDAEREEEIASTSLLLEKANGVKPVLFRPPYGARTAPVLQEINAAGLRNVMWNIDSEDWADPIPESVAARVIHQLNVNHRGIILFHDTHKQGVLALPIVLNELVQQNYTFLAYDGKEFRKSLPPVGAERSVENVDSAPPAVSDRPSPYRKSWAVIIGINDYKNWPQLRYPVNDANAIEQTLITKFGFAKENIRKLLNGDATRQRIMQVLGDELTDAGKVSREDRVFFFFAGHGATRTLADNRQLGFLIPADADQSNYYSTAISMNSIREACDLIPAKHIYFVMDSCYSGLALTRGAGTVSSDRSYLDEITKRTARQILTAGGADQMVADDGPNGHSVFTWALLQGLDGKADLDHNGIITASELGAYISPIVSNFSKQTPVMGNLIGSEGGEFIFELQPEALGPLTQQYEDKAMRLNGQLAALEREIAAKQKELLQLTQSVQAASAKPVSMPKPQPRMRAYEMDRTARQLFRAKKYDEALALLQQAVEIKPNDAILLNNLGFLYYEAGRYNESVAWLEKTLQVDPNRKEAQGNIAYAYWKLNRKAEAKQHFERYLELFPASPKAPEVKRILQTL